MHLGNGSSVDKFKENEEVVIRALNFYLKNDYSLILLGDIEELWRFSLNEIVNRYGDTIYKTIRKFGNDRVFRIYGNHDIVWKNCDPIRNCGHEKYLAVEALKLNGKEGRNNILLIHGHQGTNDADRYSWLSRPFVKGYRYLEPLMNITNMSAAPRSPIINSFEMSRYKWAKKNGVILICGHTHRAVFGSRSKIDILKQEINELKKLLKRTPYFHRKKILLSEIIKREHEKHREKILGREFDSLGANPAPCYFNTGCALYSDGITLIEIAEDKIKLVKWHRKLQERVFDIYGSANLSECFEKLRPKFKEEISIASRNCLSNPEPQYH